jgi:hypothetical protein
LAGTTFQDVPSHFHVLPFAVYRSSTEGDAGKFNAAIR